MFAGQCSLWHIFCKRPQLWEMETLIHAFWSKQWWETAGKSITGIGCCVSSISSHSTTVSLCESALNLSIYCTCASASMYHVLPDIVEPRSTWKGATSAALVKSLNYAEMVSHTFLKKKMKPELATCIALHIFSSSLASKSEAGEQHIAYTEGSESI